ncbi:MAG TPA: cytochrome c [Granulicella sp.]
MTPIGIEETQTMGNQQQRSSFGRRFYLTQAVVFGLSLFVASTLSALSPAPQAATPAPAASAPAAQAPAKDANAQFPDNPGRATFLATCSACHSPTNVLAYHLDRDGWADIITKMVGFGASGTDQQFTEILNYLTTSFPATPAAPAAPATPPAPAPSGN